VARVAEPLRHQLTVARCELRSVVLVEQQLERDDLAPDVALDLQLICVDRELVAVHTFERSAPERPRSSSHIHTCIESGVSAFWWMGHIHFIIIDASKR
jgi:hypothetical protein